MFYDMKRLLAGVIEIGFRAAERGKRLARPGVRFSKRAYEVICGVTALLEGGVEIGFDGFPGLGLRCPSGFEWLVDCRSRDEQRENEHHHTDEQNKELHRDLHNGIEEDTQAALRRGPAREISLYLALIASEVSQSEEAAADEAAPEVVAIA